MPPALPHTEFTGYLEGRLRNIEGRRAHLHAAQLPSSMPFKPHALGDGGQSWPRLPIVSRMGTPAKPGTPTYQPAMSKPRGAALVSASAELRPGSRSAGRALTPLVTGTVRHAHAAPSRD